MKILMRMLIVLTTLSLSLTSCQNLIYEPDKTSHNYESLELYKKSDDWYRVNIDPNFQLEIRSEDQKYPIGYGTYPFILSSLETNPINAEFARQYLQISDDGLSSFTMFCETPNNSCFTYNIEHHLLDNNKSEAGFYKGMAIESDNADIVLGLYATDEVPIESDKLRYEIIAYVPLVFFVSESNNISSLTTEQLIGIYSGEINNFKKLGGYNAKIKPYQRSELTYAQIMMRDIMGDTRMLKVKEVDSGGINTINPEPVDYYNSKGSIGYALGNAAEKLYGSQIKILNVDGVSPSDENVRNEKYPYYAAIYAVSRNDNYVGNAFIDWILSEDGQRCIDLAGYVPVLELKQ